MKKSLENLIEQMLKELKKHIGWECYVSDIVADTRYKNYKYFLKFCNTHSVFKRFKTQKELEFFCQQVIDLSNKEGQQC